MRCVAPHVPLLLALTACAADDPTPLDVIVDPSLEAPDGQRFSCYGPIPEDTVGCTGGDGHVWLPEPGDPTTIHLVDINRFEGWFVDLSLRDDRASVCLQHWSDVAEPNEPRICAYYGHVVLSARALPLTVFFQAAFEDDAQMSARFVVDP